MPRSMTGFGAADGMVGGGRLHVEVKTVNHRHFNPQLKLPGVLQEHEGRLRDALRERLDRGHVTVSARWLEEADRPSRIEIDPDRATAYRDAFHRLADHLGVEPSMSLELLARQPEVLTVRSEEAAPVPWPEIETVLRAALDGVVTARHREGEVLAQEVANRVESIRRLLAGVAARAPERLSSERDRLKAAVEELVGGSAVDESRLAQEIAILADKLDVTEETVRLGAHLEACTRALATDDAVGKQLGFLGQEMLREINTIGSKANDAEIAHAVVAMKGELEKFREQVENIE